VAHRSHEVCKSVKIGLAVTATLAVDTAMRNICRCHFDEHTNSCSDSKPARHLGANPSHYSHALDRHDDRCRDLVPGVPVYRGNSHCTPFFTNLCLAVEHCWVFCIGSCEPIQEDRTGIGSSMARV